MHPFINHIRQFVALTDEQAETVLQHTQTVEAKKKELLLKEGQVCHTLYFVASGCMRMYFVNEKGVEQTVQFAIENWWMADYASYNSQSTSLFCIQAIEQCTLCNIDLLQQELMLKAVPAMERYFRIILQKAYAASQLRMKYIHELSKTESYHQFSTRYPEFLQRVPQYMLASYLGFTPEYLSEIRKNEAKRIS